MSGVENGQLQVARYAKDIQLIVTLDRDNIEMIYPPYL
jgi:hypothetical protein